MASHSILKLRSLTLDFLSQFPQAVVVRCYILKYMTRGLRVQQLHINMSN